MTSVPTKAWRLPLFLSGFLLLSQSSPAPSPVRDALTGNAAANYVMAHPWGYLAMAPFCGLADRLSVLPFNQIIWFIAFVVLAVMLMAGVRRGLLVFAGFLVFATWAVLMPRPAARLISQDPSIVLIDFHSHTETSHDARKTFSAERNMRWHQAQGFNAAFITDHNRTESAARAKALSRQNWRTTGYRSLEGEELSLWKTHLVVLGNHERIDNVPYDSDPAKVPLLITDMKKRGWPVIAALPEYWEHRWESPMLNPLPLPIRGQAISQHSAAARAVLPSPVQSAATGKPSIGSINDLVRWGISGFEIVNSAPKALGFPVKLRREVGQLAKAHNLPVFGVSDTHGYGFATAAWSAMRIPGWDQLDPDQLEDVILKTLATRGFEAVDVLERVRYNTGSIRRLLISPVMTLGLYWRGLTPPEIVSWIAWIWVLVYFWPRRRLTSEAMPHG